MHSYIRSVFSRRNNTPRYRLSDTWEPTFENELRLAVASFFADDAFHRVFGEGRNLDEKAVFWHFIGLVISRRKNPARHMITIRRNRTIKALLSGGLNCGEENIGILEDAIKSRLIPLSVRPIENSKSHIRRHKRIIHSVEAKQDAQMEACIKKYFKQIGSRGEGQRDAPIHFVISMIAVDPAEQGKGHLRMMLEKLISHVQEIPLVEYIEVSTYDKTKVSIYKHLGFSSHEQLQGDGVRSWVLNYPIVRTPAS